ncbi:MAG: SOS response-associated peptidase family protein [Alphaproteobacteria bacterium]
MCNLYNHAASPGNIQHFFEGAKLKLSDRARGKNIEPGYVGADQDGVVLVNAHAKSTLNFETMRWGFPAIREGAKPITNIRNLKSNWWRGANGEYLMEQEYRCLVPFDKFAEWDGKEKKNAWFAIDAPQSFFAGIWRPWNGERLVHVEGEKRRERRVLDWNLYAFLTTTPNEVVAPIHPKAMPVILTTPDECEAWMAGGEESLSLQRPLDAAITKLT